VGSRPFLVGVHSEASIRLLIVKKGTYSGPFWDESSRLLDFGRVRAVVGKLRQREIADGGIVRPKEPYNSRIMPIFQPLFRTRRTLQLTILNEFDCFIP